MQLKLAPGSREERFLPVAAFHGTIHKDRATKREERRRRLKALLSARAVKDRTVARVA